MLVFLFDDVHCYYYCIIVGQVASGILTPEDDLFPSRLLDVKPSVSKLYFKGTVDSSIFSRCVAIVGSRKMTRYGKQVLSWLIPELVAQGYTTVSGFMHGVDIEVHRLTYLNGGRTIAVLGWGINKKNDVENDDLYHKLIDNSSLFVSEYKENMAPNRATFPQRNRIVAGLADEVMVIEGAKNSGSLITAGLAVKFGRKLWAVPGPVTSEMSEGTNNLIKEGLAEMLTLDEIKLYSRKDPKNRQNDDLSDDESKIVELLIQKGSVGMNELVRLLKIPIGEIMSTVTDLSMKGIVISDGGYVSLS